jgi:hypothetical protein
MARTISDIMSSNSKSSLTGKKKKKKKYDKGGIGGLFPDLTKDARRKVMSIYLGGKI